MRAAIVFAALCIALPAFAADAAPAPAVPSCDTPEHHQLDFWLGTWKLTWNGGTGTNTITRALNDCVIEENFAAETGPPPLLRGMSISSYPPMNKMWRQTWADDQNGYLHLSGGQQQDGSFMLQTIRMGREPYMTRMVFQDIQHDTFTWRWQKSDDGDAWTDIWVVKYARIK